MTLLKGFRSKKKRKEMKEMEAEYEKILSEIRKMDHEGLNKNDQKEMKKLRNEILEFEDKILDYEKQLDVVVKSKNAMEMEKEEAVKEVKRLNEVIKDLELKLIKSKEVHGQLLNEVAELESKLEGDEPNTQREEKKGFWKKLFKSD